MPGVRARRIGAPRYADRRPCHAAGPAAHSPVRQTVMCMRKRATTTEPTALVQVMRLWWDKSARGGQGACARNAVPAALRVPESQLRDAAGNIVAEVHQWSSHDAFAAPSRSLYKVPASQGWGFGCVCIAPQDDTVHVRF